ncbi:hypothetical protein C8F01DRAFT_1243595 [Mycena amicta]|nr:hypothetical protein C8F01DRAFT_1243595 [Mycena amicta]
MSTFAGYLRTASLAVAFYDYLQTLPFEFRMFRDACKGRRLTLSFILFILIRYTSIAALTISNFGFFDDHFSYEACRRYFLFPSVFKVVQAMVSQAILGVRAYNLSRKSANIGYILLCIYVICCTLEWVTTLYDRTIAYNPDIGNCASMSPRSALGGWVHYAVAIVYDFATSVFCVVFLLKLRTIELIYNVAGSPHVREHSMLVDGLWYFLALVLVNIVNLVFYRATNMKKYQTLQSAVEAQTAAASLGYTVTWVMSGKLLIHLHGKALYASVERRNESIDGAITVTQQLSSARDVSRAIRSQFESKSGGRLDLTVPDFESSVDGVHEDVDVQVRVERTVRVEPLAKIYELEDYSRQHTRSSRQR